MGDQFATLGPEVKFNVLDQAQPQFIYLAREDLITFNAFTNALNVVLIIEGKLLRPDGTISPFSFNQPVTAGLGPNLFQFGLEEGFLISLDCISFGGQAQTAGQIFVKAFVTRGTQTTPRYQFLFQGYPTALSFLHFPGGINKQERDGRGWFHTVAPANPAAGAEASAAVPAQNLWRVVCVQVTLSASATVANRRVQLRIRDIAGLDICRIPSAADQTAGQLATYNWASTFPSPVSFGATLVTIQNLMPFPADMHLPNNCIIDTVTANLQVGDQYSGFRVYVEEWQNTQVI